MDNIELNRKVHQSHTVLDNLVQEIESLENIIQYLRNDVEGLREENAVLRFEIDQLLEGKRD